jgi:hypothetical protein
MLGRVQSISLADGSRIAAQITQLCAAMAAVWQPSGFDRPLLYSSRRFHGFRMQSRRREPLSMIRKSVKRFLKKIMLKQS